MSAIELYFDALKKTDVAGRTPRVACRAVVVKNDSVLLLYLPGPDLFNLPGGGMEEGESETACVLRELKEETGLTGRVVAKTVTVLEHYQNGSWESRFFLVDADWDSRGEQSLTAEEQSQGMEPRWMNVFDALELFETYDSRHPHGSNVHNREFLGLIHSIQNTPA